MHFIDTNIILRLILNDIPPQHDQAIKILKDAEKNNTPLYLSQMVIHEIIFTLEKTYKYKKSDVNNTLIPLIQLDFIKMDKKERIINALLLHLEKNIPYPDAYLVIRMEEQKSTHIYSFDLDFDKIKSIKRIPN